MPTASEEAAAKALGEAIKRRRKALGLSQYKLAAALAELAESEDDKVSRQQIALIEVGKSGSRGGGPANPEWRTLLRLCRALGGRLVIDVNSPAGYEIEFVEDRS